jgi:hypothetical protein
MNYYTTTTPAPKVVKSLAEDEITTLRNSNSWLSLQLLAIARILELPSDKTMKDLEEHAKAIMVVYKQK